MMKSRNNFLPLVKQNKQKFFFIRTQKWVLLIIFFLVLSLFQSNSFAKPTKFNNVYPEQAANTSRHIYVLRKKFHTFSQDIPARQIDANGQKTYSRFRTRSNSYLPTRLPGGSKRPLLLGIYDKTNNSQIDFALSESIYSSGKEESFDGIKLIVASQRKGTLKQPYIVKEYGVYFPPQIRDFCLSLRDGYDEVRLIKNTKSRDAGKKKIKQKISDYFKQQDSLTEKQLKVAANTCGILVVGTFDVAKTPKGRKLKSIADSFDVYDNPKPTKTVETDFDSDEELDDTNEIPYKPLKKLVFYNF